MQCKKRKGGGKKVQVQENCKEKSGPTEKKEKKKSSYLNEASISYFLFCMLTFESCLESIYDSLLMSYQDMNRNVAHNKNRF